MNLQNLVDFCEGAGLPSPFEGANVPAPLNLESVINAIMIRCGLLTPIYPEPDVFREMTRHWFDVKQWTFEHIINIIEAEYSPIENVFEERTETTTYGHTNTKTGGFKDTNGGKDTVKDSGKDSVKDSGKDTISASGSDTVEQSGTDERDISNSGTDTTTNTISAFNSSTYQPDNQSATQHGHTVDDDITYGKSEETTYGKSEDTTYGKQSDTTYGKQTETTHGHSIERVYNSEKDTQGGKDELSVKRHGNVGITSSDELINQELELLRHFDAYGFIAELFEKDNMIMIY